jgi:Uma2 family endonuclease
MMMNTQSKIAIEALDHMSEKADVVTGETVRMSPVGWLPIRASGHIFRSLSNYEEERGGGYAIQNNAGFIVDLPNRNLLSPNAAWYTGEVSAMSYLPKAPAFVVEVRSESDYGADVELKIIQKRNDYFAAGTIVVWDVDLLGDDVVRVYRAGQPDTPTIYRRGEVAEAEPAVHGWRMPVDDLFK